MSIVRLGITNLFWGKVGRGQLKCDGTRAETRFLLSAKWKSPFKSAVTSGSRGMRVNGSNAGYTTFRGGVKDNGYPFHSPFAPSLPLPASPCAITFQLDSTDCSDLCCHWAVGRWRVGTACLAAGDDRLMKITGLPLGR